MNKGDSMTDTFEKLAENLTAVQKIDFLRVLNKNQITVESDTVLSKFFLTLQIYVAMYEKIPKSIHEATTWFQTAIEKATGDFKKPVADMAQLKTEIDKLTRQTKQSAENAEASRERISEELARVYESLENINESVREGTEKAAATVSERMTELLSAAMEKAMPLSGLKEAGKVFSGAVKEGKQASAELRENVKHVRRARFRMVAAWAAIAAIFIIMGTAAVCHSLNERRIEEMRTYYPFDDISFPLPRLTADMRESQKVKGLWLPQFTLLPIARSESPKLYQPGLLRV